MNTKSIFQFNLRRLVLAGLFIALDIAAARFLSFYVIPQTEKMSVQPLIYAFGAYFLGPVYSVITFVISDVLGMLINNQGMPYFWQFTLVAAIRALLYSLILYKKPINIPRTIIAFALGCILIEILTTSFIFHLLFKKAFIFYFIQKLTFKPFYVPVFVAIFYPVMKNLVKNREIKAFFDSD